MKTLIVALILYAPSIRGELQYTEDGRNIMYCVSKDAKKVENCGAKPRTMWEQLNHMKYLDVDPNYRHPATEFLPLPNVQETGE